MYLRHWFVFSLTRKLLYFYSIKVEGNFLDEITFVMCAENVHLSSGFLSPNLFPTDDERSKPICARTHHCLQRSLKRKIETLEREMKEDYDHLNSH